VSAPLQKVLDRLEHVRCTRKGWIARCPAHEDRHPSPSVGVGDDGRILLHCFAGCEVQTVVAALGLEMADQTCTRMRLVTVATPDNRRAAA
jgi:hypothetical protein